MSGGLQCQRAGVRKRPKPVRPAMNNDEGLQEWHEGFLTEDSPEALLHPSLLGFKQSFGKFVAECKSPKPSSNLLRDLGKALFESSQEVEAFLVKTNESLARKRKENLETEARRSRLESELDVWVRHRTGRGILEFEEFLKCKDLRGAGVDPEVVRFQERVAYLENQVADLHSQLQQNLEMSVEELKGEEAVVGQVKSIMSKAGKEQVEEIMIKLILTNENLKKEKEVKDEEVKKLQDTLGEMEKNEVLAPDGGIVLAPPPVDQAYREMEEKLRSMKVAMRIMQRDNLELVEEKEREIGHLNNKLAQLTSGPDAMDIEREGSQDDIAVLKKDVAALTALLEKAQTLSGAELDSIKARVQEAERAEGAKKEFLEDKERMKRDFEDEVQRVKQACWEERDEELQRIKQDLEEKLATEVQSVKQDLEEERDAELQRVKQDLEEKLASEVQRVKDAEVEKYTKQYDKELKNFQLQWGEREEARKQEVEEKEKELKERYLKHVEAVKVQMKDHYSEEVKKKVLAEVSRINKLKKTQKEMKKGAALSKRDMLVVKKLGVLLQAIGVGACDAETLKTHMESVATSANMELDPSSEDSDGSDE